MVVLQKMQHDSYVNKKCYAAHAKAARIPLPKDLSPDLKRGDFDILIIHRMYGLIVAEIKSVGRRPGQGFQYHNLSLLALYFSTSLSWYC